MEFAPSTNKDARLTRWMWVALINFFLAGCLGMLLRFAFVREMTWFKYSNVLHAHSHLAMLGWIFLLLYVLLIKSFLPQGFQSKSFYQYFFWLIQITVIGMLISFALQGYGIVSIPFALLNVLLTYVFIYHFWNDLNKSGSGRSTQSVWLVKIALFFLGISQLGALAMGPLIAMHLNHSATYYTAIHFYLHFQFNGWFIFSILALFFKMIEKKGVSVSSVLFKCFLVLFVASNFLTFALAIAWSNPRPIVFLSNSIGVSLQLASLILLIIMLYEFRKLGQRVNKRQMGTFLIMLAFAALILKVLVQTAVVLPTVAEVAYTIRNYMIGFFHLMFLGIITVFGFGFAHQHGLLNLDTHFARIGLWLFLIGFLLSELILFVQGTMFWGGKGFLPFYYELLFVVTVLLPLGIAILIISQTRRISFSSIRYGVHIRKINVFI